jgi:hypothetical protein
MIRKKVKLVTNRAVFMHTPLLIPLILIWLLTNNKKLEAFITEMCSEVRDVFIDEENGRIYIE